MVNVMTARDAGASKRRARVLVLSGEIPQTRLAGAIVLHRLFAGYPSDRLFVIGPRPQDGAKLLDCPYRELWMPLRRFEQTRLSVHKRSLSACGLIPLPWHGRVTRMLGDFKPDVVVCVMANTPWMLTAERTARKLGIPLVLIVHDLNEEFEHVFPWARRSLFTQNQRVYRSAARRLCVSPEMASYLADRYGERGEVMYPNRSEDLIPRPVDAALLLKDAPRLTLGYAGSLAYGYGEALVGLIPVLREVGARILISTPQPPEKLAQLSLAQDVVEWMPHRVDINAMWREMQERADVMILPYAMPAGRNELLYRTHFPSKLTEYLGLGMPVVVVGPEFAAGVRWAGHSANGGAAGGAVASTSREELGPVLKKLTENGDWRREMAQLAVEAGLRDFDPTRIVEGFHGLLQNVAMPHKSSLSTAGCQP